MRNRALPKNRKKSTTGRVYDGRAEAERMERLLKDLTEFESFREQILPAIRKDLLSGYTAAQLREKYAAMIQARIITEALTNPDAGKANLAGKDIIDRVEGKATEKREVKHTFENLSDEELEAILKSEEEELEDMAARFDQ